MLSQFALHPLEKGKDKNRRQKSDTLQDAASDQYLHCLLTNESLSLTKTISLKTEHDLADIDLSAICMCANIKIIECMS